MELTRKEEYRNKKISVGVTVLSFIVMLLFLVFKNIITSNPSFKPDQAIEMTLSTVNASDEDINGSNKSAEALSLKQTQSADKKIVSDPQSDIPFKSGAAAVADNYRTAVTTSQSDKTSDSENNLPVTTEGSSTETNEVNKNSKFGFDLEKRTIIGTPGFTNDTKEEGKVVVEIVVDKAGHVIEANPNGRGTSTTSSILKAKAKQMAVATKFSADQKTEEQRGTITIIFSFN